jgi:pSer/pThr/pTyr-binding forkhead associated (FHA) protein
MFALEIVFSDQNIPSETLLIRRPSALIGGQEYAHVAIDDLANISYQLRIVRQIGRSFDILPVGQGAEFADLGGRFDRVAKLDFGTVSLIVTSLDIDFCLNDSEPPDKAGVRILREAINQPFNQFPAVITSGPNSIVLSFSEQATLIIGRSRECQLRIDSPDISSQHAKIGFNNNKFWVEDLGSTNGTFIDNEQVYGRQIIESGKKIKLGGNFTLAPVLSHIELEDFKLSENSHGEASEELEKFTYPVVISTSEVVRPPRFSLKAGQKIVLGRDPNSDIWLAAPHISRQHCSITFSYMDPETGEVYETLSDSNRSRLVSSVKVMDQSTNGIGLNSNQLTRGQKFKVVETPSVIDFGGGVTLAICFDDYQEKIFTEANGSVLAFIGNEMPEIVGMQTTATNLATEKSKQIGRNREATKDYIGVENTSENTYKRRKISKPVLITVLMMLVVIAFVVINVVAGIIKAT